MKKLKTKEFQKSIQGKEYMGSHPATETNKSSSSTLNFQPLKKDAVGRLMSENAYYLLLQTKIFELTKPN